VIAVACLHFLGGKAAAASLSADGVPPGAASSNTVSTGAAPLSNAPSGTATPSGPVNQKPYQHVLYTGTGSPGDGGGGYTTIFTAKSEWSISYTYDCSNLGRPGEFMIFEQGGARNGAMPVMVLSRQGSAVYFEHDDPGRHYLAIESLCRWTIRVADQG
jgi:hypothetical protein